MKDCERCKNVEICKLEKPKDKCAFLNPLSAYEQIICELKNEFIDGEGDYAEGLNRGIQKAINIVEKLMK